MKKTVYIAAAAMLCLVEACTLNPGTGQQNPDTPKLQGDLAAYPVYYQLRVVNNTGGTVVLYNSETFAMDAEGSVSIYGASQDVLCEVGGNSEETCEFDWYPKYTLYYSDDPEHPDPSAKEIKETRFKPMTYSFYLKIGINGEDYYLAGWPESIELPSVAKELGDITLPRERIVQYGIGYCENTEVRIKNDFAYVPMIIKYVDAGQTAFQDFDDADYIHGTATLTMNSASDMVFKTESLLRSSPLQ